MSLAGRCFSNVILCFTHCSAAMRFYFEPSAWQEFCKPGGGVPGSTEFVRDRTQTRRKHRVQGGLVARYEPDDSELRPFLGPCRASLRN